MHGPENQATNTAEIDLASSLYHDYVSLHLYQMHGPEKPQRRLPSRGADSRRTEELRGNFQICGSRNEEALRGEFMHLAPTRGAPGSCAEAFNFVAACERGACGSQERVYAFGCVSGSPAGLVLSACEPAVPRAVLAGVNAALLLPSA